MTKNTHRLSIGLPVYNGEKYLAETLDSLLLQTFCDFELIISDNASSDRTQEICTSYAKQDSRIRYHRQSENLGASANYNLVFAESDAKYFKWAAHDDLYAPTFLERCMELLDEREDVVLAFTRGQEIDENGVVTREYPDREGIAEMNDYQRFKSMVVGYQPFIPVFGVAHRKTLAQTKLIGGYSGSDRPLIGELALRGNLFEVPEILFSYRVHREQSWGGGKSKRAQQAWYDPSRKGRLTFPTWRLLLEHELSMWRVPMNSMKRIKLHGVMLRWMRTRWRLLAGELTGQ